MVSDPMSPAETLEMARARLAALADPAVRDGMQRYFKGAVRAYGVSAPKVRKLSQEIYRNVKPWPAAQRNRFCTDLFRGGLMEEGALAIYLYRRFARTCAECEFKLFERWIDRFVDNWAWCDGVSSWLVAASLANAPSLIDQIPAWTASKNRWKRRAAAVALVPFARRGRQIETILDIADRLRQDSDDMVRKGVGWLLKDAYPARPREVVRFLTATEPPFPRLVLRIAAEKMTAAGRRAVLAS
jgi:3-methyladenine DNA glycosylase AlkD